MRSVGGASNGGVYLEPQLQVGYSRWDSNRHTEANGTVVSTENANGLFGRAGLRLSGVTRPGNGAAEVQPYLAANWLRTRAESQIRMDDEIADARAAQPWRVQRRRIGEVCQRRRCLGRPVAAAGQRLSPDQCAGGCQLQLVIGRLQPAVDSVAG